MIKEEEKGFFEKLKNRPNVIVMGDSMGDALMDVGLESEQTVFKVGFLNKEVSCSVFIYLKIFYGSGSDPEPTPRYRDYD